MKVSPKACFSLKCIVKYDIKARRDAENGFKPVRTLITERCTLHFGTLLP